MYKYKDIVELHLEVTEKCNAACPMCPRNIHGGKENPHIINAELSLEDCKKMFDPVFIKQLRHMYMCGNYGDPIMAKDTLEIFKYFREHNPKIYLRMHTNAGARPAKWWIELAKTIGKRGRVIFSVDGLEDTNHLYRQNIKWKNVERGMKAYIGSGYSEASWHFLAFKHNEHQYKEAETLAKELGFDTFLIKKTSRFYSYAGGNKGFQVLDKEGNNAHMLEPPTDENYQNVVAKTADQYIKKQGTTDLKEFYDITKIDSKCITKKEIFVSARGLILPCCWVGGTLYRWELDDPQSNQSWEFINKVGGPDAINAIKPWNTIESILDKGNFFNDIENSWTLPSVKQGKLSVCTRMCATGLDKFSEQFNRN
tara:strand:- start:494 stop:1597 length:1104 start_codon:yes stop_codon:yes gene_type:complete